jgi:hypothetical protein
MILVETYADADRSLGLATWREECWEQAQSEYISAFYDLRQNKGKHLAKRPKLTIGQRIEIETGADGVVRVWFDRIRMVGWYAAPAEREDFLRSLESYCQRTREFYRREGIEREEEEKEEQEEVHRPLWWEEEDEPARVGSSSPADPHLSGLACNG